MFHLTTWLSGRRKQNVWDSPLDAKNIMFEQATVEKESLNTKVEVQTVKTQ